MQPGDTFHADLGHGKHLHVVLSHPYGEANDLYVVTMISTYTEDYQDCTCIIRPSDGHPFITRISYVAYSVTREVCERDLEIVKATIKSPLSDDVLRRVLKGADAYKSEIPIKFLRILSDQGLFSD